VQLVRDCLNAFFVRAGRVLAPFSSLEIVQQNDHRAARRSGLPAVTPSRCERRQAVSRGPVSQPTATTLSPTMRLISCVLNFIRSRKYDPSLTSASAA